MDCLEDYKNNKWFYFYAALVLGAEICAERKQQKKEKVSGINIGTNGQKQKGI